MSDRGVIKVSEWSRKSFSTISLGRFGVVWTVNLVSKLLAADAAIPFALKFNKASIAFLAQRCGNKAGHYVAIIEYGEGHHRGTIMVPEGVDESGWNLLANCFPVVVDFLGSLRKGSSSLGDAGRRKGVSFAYVAKRSPPPVYSGKAFSKIGVKSKAVGGSDVQFSMWRGRRSMQFWRLTVQVLRRWLLMRIQLQTDRVRVSIQCIFTRDFWV
ncbi:hypothetical protein CJ030_MR2G007847 [Morella rubra]|uniref:Uncharacterized protein n=1 Tax=Morella rubra TaxID=262757 RepID=A0A6A1WI27_9ROSI|nr:hypothetical protein CJ030_MR2G007847 [Morella rubra]